MNKRFLLLACVSFVNLCSIAGAGTYKTITIDDDHSDWIGVPIVNIDLADNPGSVDLAETQIANDNDFLYIRNTFHGNLSLNLFTGIDVDENVATGFDIFGLGLIGQDSGWQTDFPFTSSNNAFGGDVFNNGQGMTGDFFGIGAILLDAFADSNERELAISLDIVRNPPTALVSVFPDNTVRLLFWTDLGGTDVSTVIDYTLAVPEPATAVLLAALAGCLTIQRRR
ncbi:MAG: PEP-CTERM sorting domain-containing protein [Bythopirellula sp.]|nr:PEP-CTERM sorting domain-containing protein [Bythopirellula sp.]